MSIRDSISSQKTKRNKWIEDKNAERETVNAHADNGISIITTDPETYAAYLKTQADNLSFSPTNIAIVMESRPNATKIHRAGGWENRGRKIIPDEKIYGTKIFLPMSEEAKARKNLTGNYTVIGMVYDISQTSGQEISEAPILNTEEKLTQAIGAFVSASKADVEFDGSIAQAAFYDPESQTLLVNPDRGAKEIFADLSRETVYANRHGGGKGFDKRWYQLEAESVGYMTCRHYLGEAQMPDVSSVTDKFEGRPISERTKALKDTMWQLGKIKRNIDRELKIENREREQEPQKTEAKTAPEPERP